MPVRSTMLPLAPTVAPLGEPVRAVFDRLAAERYRFVQLSATQPGVRPRELDQSARRDLGASLRRRELAVSGLDCWIPVEHYLDPARCDRAIAAVLAAIELAASLERCPVSLTLPRESEAGAEAVLDEVASCAMRAGVAIADHAMPSATVEGIGAGLDPAAYLAAGDEPAAVATSFGPRLVSARLCDLLTSGMRGPVGDSGSGRLDVLAYRVGLSVGGYDRPVIVDARQWIDPWGGLAQTRRAWSDASPSESA